MELQFPSMDPAAMVRDYVQSYASVYGLLSQATGVPDAVKLKTPDEQPILDLDLPVGLRDAIAEFQRTHSADPDFRAIKYMLVVNGVPQLVIENQEPLPAEDALATFSHTISVLAQDTVTVTTHQLVASRAPAGKAV